MFANGLQAPPKGTQTGPAGTQKCRSGPQALVAQWIRASDYGLSRPKRCAHQRFPWSAPSVKAPIRWCRNPAYLLGFFPVTACPGGTDPSTQPMGVHVVGRYSLSAMKTPAPPGGAGVCLRKCLCGAGLGSARDGGISRALEEAAEGRRQDAGLAQVTGTNRVPDPGGACQPAKIIETTRDRVRGASSSASRSPEGRPAKQRRRAPAASPESGSSRLCPGPLEVFRPAMTSIVVPSRWVRSPARAATSSVGRAPGEQEPDHGLVQCRRSRGCAEQGLELIGVQGEAPPRSVRGGRDGHLPARRRPARSKVGCFHSRLDSRVPSLVCLSLCVASQRTGRSGRPAGGPGRHSAYADDRVRLEGWRNRASIPVLGGSRRDPTGHPSPRAR